MEKNLTNKIETNFESIKHTDQNGVEFWYARELMTVLEYKQWRRFEQVIRKAKEACENSNININDHFADVGKIVKAGVSNKDIGDIKLTRYACYLIAQNGDSRKKTIAFAQTYFAIQTRKQEITRQEYEKLSEEEKRLYTRQNVKNKNKYLFDTAKSVGVKNYGKFNNYGYRGLYNGETAKDIASRKGISDKEDILDYMSSTELAANLFRITQTDEILKNRNINNENDACITHHKVGQAVRQTIKKIGGTMPENLPTPSKSTIQIEKESNNKIAQWVSFIDDPNTERVEKIVKNNKEVKKAREVLYGKSKDEELERLAFLKERTIMEEDSMREEAIEEGIQEGKKQGMQQGLKEGERTSKLEIAKRLKKMKMNIKDIEEATGLTAEEIENEIEEKL